MSDNQEPTSNMRFVHRSCAPRADPQLARRDPKAYLDAWVKKTFVGLDGVREHMWIHVDGMTPEGHLTGLLANVPMVTPLSYGDRVECPMAAIEALLQRPRNAPLESICDRCGVTGWHSFSCPHK